MKPSDLVILAVHMIHARLPLLTTGAPGIGKSDLIARAADLAGADLILSHPAVSDPTDAKGLPWVVNGSATFLPFGELERAIAADKPTVWFLDDLGQASPAVQASYMQLLLARRVNGHAISEHITFIAATNRRTDRAGVSGILEPVKSRFASIVELEPDLDDWCTWAISADVEPLVIAFVRFQPDLLCKFTASNDLLNSPVPRTWSHVDRIVKMQLPPAISHTAICGAVGEGAATEFAAFVRLYREMPNIDKILIDPNSVDIPHAPATLYALSTALAARSNPQNFDRVATFLSRLVAAGHAEFGALCLKDSIKRDDAVTHTNAFVKIVTGELGQLISGK